MDIINAINAFHTDDDIDTLMNARLSGMYIANVEYEAGVYTVYAEPKESNDTDDNTIESLKNFMTECGFNEQKTLDEGTARFIMNKVNEMESDAMLDSLSYEVDSELREIASLMRIDIRPEWNKEYAPASLEMVYDQHAQLYTAHREHARNAVNADMLARFSVAV